MPHGRPLKDKHRNKEEYKLTPHGEWICEYTVVNFDGENDWCGAQHNLRNASRNAVWKCINMDGEHYNFLCDEHYNLLFNTPAPVPKPTLKLTRDQLELIHSIMVNLRIGRPEIIAICETLSRGLYGEFHSTHYLINWNMRGVAPRISGVSKHEHIVIEKY